MATLKIWDEPGYTGNWKEIYKDEKDLRNVNRVLGGNWNDEIQSFHVISGMWKLFEHINFDGLGTQEFKTGDKVRSCPDAGFPNKWVSSIQLLGE